MIGLRRLLLVVVVLLIGSPAWAQQRSGWLGAEVQDVTRQEAERLRWDAPRGAKVRVVEPSSPAARVGLKPGDIILSIDRTEIDGAAEFDAVMDVKRPGANVVLRVFSGGRDVRMTATLLETPKVPTGDLATPHLMLDTGWHMGLVAAVAITPDGRTAISGGDDKSIRLWDIATGRTTRVLRGDVSAGLGGRISALAVSRDGLLLAAGVHVAGSSRTHAVQVYSLITFEPVATFASHDGRVESLEFSSDSGRLLSAGEDGRAVVWNLRTGKADVTLDLQGKRIFKAAFAQSDRHIVTAGDNFDGRAVHIWSSGGQHLRALEDFSTATSMAVSPLDGTIAAGGWNGTIQVWDGETGQRLRSTQVEGASIWALQYTAGAAQLVATLTLPTEYGQSIVFAAKTLTRMREVQHARAIRAALHPDGRSIVVAGLDVGTWSLTSGEKLSSAQGLGSPIWAVGFSGNGKQLLWGKTDRFADAANRGPLEFAFDLPTAGSGLGRLGAYTADRTDAARGQGVRGEARLSLPGASNRGTRRDLHILEGDKRVGLIDQWDVGGVWTFTYARGAILASSGRGHIFEYDMAGNRKGEFIGHSGSVYALAPSPDGRFLASGSADQTVRLWNLQTHELVVSLFHGANGEWVMWTPQGYYTGSPGADKIVGWQINRGSQQSAEYVTADQLRQHLNRPDIVEKAILMASAEQAVSESHGTSFRLADLLLRPVPKFHVVAPAAGSIQHGGRSQIKIAIETLPDPVKYIRVQVNGRQVEEINAHIGVGGLDPGERLLDIPMANGRNDISITLGNVVGLKTQSIALVHDGDGDLDRRGTLYILAVGVDRYPGLGNTCGPDNNASCDLRFSGADARRLADAAERRLGPTHAKVVKRVLVNDAGAEDAPTASNILDAIDVLKQSKETDTVLLFIAGHGTNDGSSYRFLATNAERVGENFRSATVVPWQFLQDAIETARGRRILFIDTCHSGNAYNRQLGNAAYHANIVAYTATRFDQEALEDARLGHGLFTYALAEGLDGKGAVAAKREISTKELADYVAKRVDQLAKAIKGEQEPQYFKGRDAEDYVLARW